jgi:hypothetical protein
MDPLAFLEETDPVKLAVALSISRRYFARRKELDDYLASKIIHSLGEAMK